MNKIALLNDAFRKTLSGGKVLLTPGVRFGDMHAMKSPYSTERSGALMIARELLKATHPTTLTDAGCVPVDPCTSPAIARGFLSTSTNADAPHNACDGREYNQTPLGDW